MQISELKNKSIFIPKDVIVPNWIIKIVKGNKKEKHKIKSNGFYVYRINDSIICFPQIDGEYCIKLKDMKNFEISLNPYGINGGSITAYHDVAIRLSEKGVFAKGCKSRLC